MSGDSWAFAGWSRGAAPNCCDFKTVRLAEETFTASLLMRNYPVQTTQRSMILGWAVPDHVTSVSRIVLVVENDPGCHPEVEGTWGGTIGPCQDPPIISDVEVSAGWATYGGCCGAWSLRGSITPFVVPGGDQTVFEVAAADPVSGDPVETIGPGHRIYVVFRQPNNGLFELANVNLQVWGTSDQPVPTEPTTWGKLKHYGQ